MPLVLGVCDMFCILFQKAVQNEPSKTGTTSPGFDLSFSYGLPVSFWISCWVRAETTCA